MKLTLANTADLVAELSRAAATGAETAAARWINGRLVGVLASPADGAAEHLAIGVSALPAGVSTPPHNHEAEEIAIVLSGGGQIVIDGEPIPVAAGAVVRTPPNAPHTTVADRAGPLVILWVYAPAGSEGRWLDANPAEGVDQPASGSTR